MFLSRLTSLLEDDLAGKSRKKAVAVLLFFAIAIGLIIIAAAPEMTTREAFMLELIEDFHKDPRLDMQSLSYVEIHKYVTSLPLNLTANSGVSIRVASLRLWGLFFLVLTLLISYQAARRLFGGHESTALIALALLATNNLLISNAVTVGGDFFGFFLFCGFVYMILEVGADASFLNIALACVPAYVVMQFDAELAGKVLVPVLFLAFVASSAFSRRREIMDRLPKAPLARLGAVFGSLVVLFAVSQASPVAGALLSTPASVLPALTGLTAWPRLIGHLSQVFSGSLSTPAGFEQFMLLNSLFFNLCAALAIAGLALYARKAVGERVSVVSGATVAAAGTSETAGLSLMVVRPENSVLTQINVPGLVSLMLLVLTALRAIDAYANPARANNNFLFLLFLPLTLLTAFGLRQARSAGGPLALAVEITLAILLALNVGGMLIAVMWR